MIRSGILYFCLIILFIFIYAPLASAVESNLFAIDSANVEYVDDPLGIGRTAYFGLPGLNSGGIDIRITIINILKYLMSFFGIIAVCVIMLAGFRWMVSGGNEEKIGAAKRMIVGGIVGMSTVVGAYAIVNLVVFTTNSVISGNF